MEHVSGKNRSSFMPLLLIFMTIFSFRLPLVYNSLVGAAAISTVLGFCDGGLWRRILFFLASSYIFTLAKSYFGIFLLATLVLLYSVSSDLTIFRGFGSVVISLVCTFIVISFLLAKYDLSAADIMRMTLYAICVQSIIQIGAFVSPAILSVVQMFQHQGDSLMLQEGYGGLRGLALSGELTFALSATYGFFFIVLFFLAIKNDVSRLGSYLIGFLLVIGSMFAGRTAFIGLLIGSLYYLMASGLSYRVLVLRVAFMMVAAILAGVGFFVFFASDQTEQLLRFAFEFVYSYLEGNSVETESTNILLDSLRFDFSLQTAIFGDGKYTNEDGSYYRKIDSGYVRQVLFGGIPFLLLCFLNQIAILQVFARPVMNSGYRGLKLLSVFILAYLAVLHIKGEAIAYIKFIQVVIFMWSLAVLHDNLYREGPPPVRA